MEIWQRAVMKQALSTTAGDNLNNVGSGRSTGGCLVSRGCLLANIMMVYVLLRVKGRSRGASLCDILAKAADTFNNMGAETNPSCSRGCKSYKGSTLPPSTHPPPNWHEPFHKITMKAKPNVTSKKRGVLFFFLQKKIVLTYILLHFVARQKKNLRRQEECLIIMESIKALFAK